MSSSPIRVGFVGLSKTGWASTALAPALLQLADQYRLTALSTSSDVSASVSAKKYSDQVGHPVKAYHGDTSQIASDPDVDLVVVAVNASLHRETVLPAIEAGKDVFVEWPAGNGLKESIELAEASRKKGIRTMVGLQSRNTPVVKKVKEMVEAGKIGKILSVSIISMVPRELGAWGPRLGQKTAYTVDAKCGGTMLKIAIGHQLDALTYILGDFVSVSATATTHYQTATIIDSDSKPTGKTVPVTAPDHIAFTGLLKSGAICSIIWRGGLPSTKGRKQFIWEIDGEDGSIRLENDGQGGTFIGIRDPELYINGDLIGVDSTAGLIGNIAEGWSQFAKGGDGNYPTLEDALRNHRLLDAIERSETEGRTIVL